MTNRDEYLKTKIFVCGHDKRVDFEEFNKNSDEFFDSIMFDKKFRMSIKLQGKLENLKRSELL